MALNRAIVDVVTGITPPVQKPTERAFEASPEGFVIEFRGGQIARLVRGALAAAMLDLLDDLRRDRTPVYVEVGPDGQAIQRLRIPEIQQVAEVREVPGGDVDVALFPSHARHTLSRKNDDFATLLAVLLDHHDKNEWLLITETDRHEIIDARPFRRDDGPALPGPPSGFARLKSFIVDTWLHWFARWLNYRLCYWLCCRWPLRCCVSMKTAWDMFNLVAPTSCVPTNPLAPCIPFLYPDDGCWARAHEMCRLMIAAGVKPAKVWIDGTLVAATKNNPYCAVHWGWHVAPTLCVRTYWCAKATYVIDPSLFTGPVTEATWKSVQGDPNATLTHTSASVYWRNAIPTDPNYVDTNVQLAKYRNRLKLRSTVDTDPNTGLPWGPPPYAHC